MNINVYIVFLVENFLDSNGNQSQEAIEINKNVQNQKFKVVDTEVKSDQVQDALTQMLSNIMEINESLSITTPSFCVNFLKHVLTKKLFQTEFSIQNGSSIKFINLPSTILENNLDDIILIKVIYNISYLFIYFISLAPG
jgi:hypothetical protein